MLWGGPFDPYIVAEIPAKELRAEVRKKGVRALPDGDKSRILVRYLEQRISGTAGRCSYRLAVRAHSPSVVTGAYAFGWRERWQTKNSVILC